MESQATERMIQPVEIGSFVVAAKFACGHGLGLQAESPGAGQGWTFTVEFPRSPTSRASGLLIVKDDEDARARVTKVLEGQGASLATRRN